MTRPIHLLWGLRIPPGGSCRMIMREGDMAVISLDLGATKLAGALFDRDGDAKTFQMGLVRRLRAPRRTPFRDPRIGDAAAAPCGSELPGRPMAQATVWPLFI